MGFRFTGPCHPGRLWLLQRLDHEGTELRVPMAVGGIGVGGGGEADVDGGGHRRAAFSLKRGDRKPAISAVPARAAKASTAA